MTKVKTGFIAVDIPCEVKYGIRIEPYNDGHSVSSPAYFLEDTNGNIEYFEKENAQKYVNEHRDSFDTYWIVEFYEPLIKTIQFADGTVHEIKI